MCVCKFAYLFVDKQSHAGPFGDVRKDIRSKRITVRWLIIASIFFLLCNGRLQDQRHSKLDVTISFCASNTKKEHMQSRNLKPLVNSRNNETEMLHIILNYVKILRLPSLSKLHRFFVSF